MFCMTHCVLSLSKFDSKSVRNLHLPSPEPLLHIIKHSYFHPLQHFLQCCIPDREFILLQITCMVDSLWFSSIVGNEGHVVLLLLSHCIISLHPIIVIAPREALGPPLLFMLTLTKIKAFFCAIFARD
jgi:hypothetical protein